MPSRPVRIAILAFWAAATGAAIWRDVLPRITAGRFDYAAIAEGRAAESAVNWRILADGERVGSVLTRIEPLSDGGVAFRSTASLSTRKLLGKQFDGNLFVQSEASVGPFGRLRGTVEVRLSLDAHSIAAADRRAAAGGRHGDLFVLRGEVSGDELIVRMEGIRSPIAGDSVRVRLDPTAPLDGAFAPLDRLPGLFVGRSWVTRSLNPLTALAGVGPGFEEAVHRVVAEEPIEWNDGKQVCYRVEHRIRDALAVTWARKADGRILRQETPFGSAKLTLELDPAALDEVD